MWGPWALGVVVYCLSVVVFGVLATLVAFLSATVHGHVAQVNVTAPDICILLLAMINSTKLNSSLLKHRSRMAKRDKVNRNK